MTDHATDHPDLLGLLRGELSNAEAIAAGDHLAGCRTCQEELAETAVGNALLLRAGRTLGPLSVDAADPTPVPVLQPRRRRWQPVLAVAAVLVLAAGVGGVIWQRSGDDSPVAGREVEASLRPLAGDEAGDGNVRMVEHDGRTTMTFDLHDLPSTSRDDFYYAWLLDPSTNKMLALGLVGRDGSASFDLDDALVASYSAVDVSLESNDGDPAHSATSVLRGSYEPDQITTAEGKPR
jgi:anti-sigma-K factor RskA